VTAPRRWTAHSLVPILLIVFVLAAVACGSTAPATTRPSTPVTPSTAPDLTPVPGRASPTAAATFPTTTETEFGTIWDALPADFPKLPGQEPAETGAGATSGSFAVNLDAAGASQAMAAAMRASGWTVDVGSPLEDGTVVLEATHAPAGCKTEVRFTPTSGTVVMSVLYGASCPFG
jgi:hypothetical protein